MRQHDTFNYDRSNYGFDYYRYYRKPAPKEKSETGTRIKLFWDFRYRFGSYKARKAGISRPSVMMRYGHDRFRIYGEPENNKLYDKCKDILKGWKARNKAEIKLLIPAYRVWLKESSHKASSEAFRYWQTNILDKPLKV